MATPLKRKASELDHWEGGGIYRPQMMEGIETIQQSGSGRTGGDEGR